MAGQDKMPDMNSRARVRLARPDDYEAVLDVNRFVYDGGDYLPVMYHMYMQNKQSDCFVIEVDGQVVGIHRTYTASQIAKTFISTSIRHRSDAKMSDRCLTDRNPWNIVANFRLYAFVINTLGPEQNGRHFENGIFL